MFACLAIGFTGRACSWLYDHFKICLFVVFSLFDKPQVALVLLLRERLFPLPNATSAVPEGPTSAGAMRARGEAGSGRRRRGNGPAASSSSSSSSYVSSKKRSEARAGQTGPSGSRAVEDIADGSGGRMVVVANTHLLFNSLRGDLKLAQLLLLLRSVCELRSKALSILKAGGPSRWADHSKGRQIPDDGSASSKGKTAESLKKKLLPAPEGVSKHAPAVVPPLSPTGLPCTGSRDCGLEDAIENLVDTFLCGDFNFTPHSPLYQLVLRGTFDFTGVDYRKLSGKQFGLSVATWLLVLAVSSVTTSSSPGTL